MTGYRNRYYLLVLAAVLALFTPAWAMDNCETMPCCVAQNVVEAAEVEKVSEPSCVCQRDSEASSCNCSLEAGSAQRLEAAFLTTGVNFEVRLQEIVSLVLEWIEEEEADPGPKPYPDDPLPKNHVFHLGPDTFPNPPPVSA